MGNVPEIMALVLVVESLVVLAVVAGIWFLDARPMVKNIQETLAKIAEMGQN
jgi:hypothetical protein